MRIIPFTKQGYENLKEALKKEIVRRPAAVEVLKRGREMGDLSENGLYKAAKMELGNIDRQIRHLQNLLLHGKPFAPADNQTIQLGHKVLVETESGKREFEITGEYEADPTANKISIRSPIGHSLMGRKVGDRTVIDAPQGKAEYKILKIKE